MTDETPVADAPAPALASKAKTKPKAKKWVYVGSHRTITIHTQRIVKDEPFTPKDKRVEALVSASPFFETA